jgi:hypothetical protein
VKVDSNKTLPIVASTLVLGLLMAPVAQGVLVGHWTFNDDTANDVTANGANGAVSGGATFVDTPGNNRGISLDGVDGVVDFGLPSHLDFSGTGPDNGVSPFTLSAWVAIDDQAGGNFHNVFGSEGNYALFYEHGGGGAARVRSTVNTGGGLDIRETGAQSVLPFGSYHHYVVTKGGAASGFDPVLLYQDGQRVATGGGRQPMAASNGKSILIGMGSGNFFDATYDELGIWDEYMNDAQVLALFNAGPTLIPEPSSIALIGLGLLVMNGLRRRIRA